MTNSSQKQESAAQCLNRFREWVSNQGTHGILYRGLTNEDWEISSSFYRRLYNSDCIKKDAHAHAETYQIYIDVHERLIRSAKKWYDIKDGVPSDLEILADLQYHGAATGLLAFTRNSLVALWFACQDARNTKTDGKVVAIDSGDANLYHVITPENVGKELNELLNGNQLWKWNVPKSNHRIVAQHLEFVFGKHSVETNNTFFISSDIKKSILDELKMFDLSEEYLFPDIHGYSQIYRAV